MMSVRRSLVYWIVSVKIFPSIYEFYVLRLIRKLGAMYPAAHLRGYVTWT